MTVREVILGDCLDILPTLPSASVDLVLGDLPYGVTANAKDRPIDLKRWWPEVLRVAKEDAAIFLTAQFPFTAELHASQPKLFRYDLVWDKVLITGHLNANKMPMRRHENILVFYRKCPKYTPQTFEGPPQHRRGSRDRKNENYGKFVDQDTGNGNTQKRSSSILTFSKAHPSAARHRTEKPVDLFQWAIESYTKRGDLVLDTTCGSGTAAVAAVKCGRDFIVIDNDEECIRITNERLKENIYV